MDRTEFLEVARKAFDQWMDEMYALAASDVSDDIAMSKIGSWIERFRGEHLERVRQSLFEEFKRAKKARNG
jgi:hypothetical protein